MPSYFLQFPSHSSLTIKLLSLQKLRGWVRIIQSVLSALSSHSVTFYNVCFWPAFPVSADSSVHLRLSSTSSPLCSKPPPSLTLYLFTVVASCQQRSPCFHSYPPPNMLSTQKPKESETPPGSSTAIVPPITLLILFRAIITAQNGLYVFATS